MTAKSRRRKYYRSRLEEARLKLYKFFTNQREVYILAFSLQEAKNEFQNRFGFWPEKENIHGDTTTEAGTTQES